MDPWKLPFPAGRLQVTAPRQESIGRLLRDAVLPGVGPSHLFQGPSRLGVVKTAY